jgi:phenol 2-monooxygenase (NADPH)
MAPHSSAVDLLIVGAGPSGLMAACWAAKYDISIRVIDQKSGRTPTGHADGLQSRTLEILDSFGLIEPILKQGVADVESCYWVRKLKETNK